MSIETLVEELRARIKELRNGRVERRIDKLNREVLSVRRALKGCMKRGDELKEIVERLNEEMKKLRDSFRKISFKLKELEEEGKRVVSKVEVKTSKVFKEIPKIHEIRRENMEKLRESVNEMRALIEERLRVKELEVEERFNNLQKDLEGFKKLYERVLLSFQTRALNELSKKVDKNLVYLNSLVESKLSELEAVKSRVRVLERDFQRYVDVEGIVKRVDLLVNKLSILSKRINSVEEKLRMVESEKIEVRQELFEVLNILSYSTEVGRIVENLKRLEGVIKRMKTMGVWDEYYEDYVTSVLSTLAENWRVYGYYNISHLFSNSLKRIGVLPSPKPDKPPVPTSPSPSKEHDQR